MDLDNKVTESTNKNQRPKDLSEVSLRDDDSRQAVRRSMCEKLGSHLADRHLLGVNRVGWGRYLTAKWWSIVDGTSVE